MKNDAIVVFSIFCLAFLLAILSGCATNNSSGELKDLPQVEYETTPMK